MIGASKILTVSYGTFSCTLEGFDEPFGTMKAIAEYFRDLAAEDRYFGAEPPTPDAAMLHRIAEREIHRRVEARVQENGVVLRAGSASDRAGDRHDSLPAPAAALRAAPAEAAPDAEPVESVAAKLMRIRAAALAATAAIVAAPEATADADATVSAAALEDDDFGYAVADEVDPAIEMVAEPVEGAVVVLAGETVADATTDDAGAAPEVGVMDDIEFAQDADDQAADDASVAAILAEAAAHDLAEHEARPLDAAADWATASDDTASDEGDGRDADAADAYAWHDDTDPADDAVTGTAPFQADDESYSADEPVTAWQDGGRAEITAGMPPLDDLDADEDDEDDDTTHDVEQTQGPVTEAQAEPPASERYAEPEAMPVPAPARFSAALEKIQRARARVIKIRRASATDAVPAEEAPPSGLTPEAAAALARALAEDKPTEVPQAPEPIAPVRPTRRPSMIEEEEPAVDASVSRLLAQTNSEMDVPEQRRRRSAIEHLKAAVAATVADRRVGGARPPSEEERADPYRTDLSRVVGPRLVQASERPTPLVLVSEQRIDHTPVQSDASSRGAIRPRRVGGSPLVLHSMVQEDEVDGDEEAFDAAEPIDPQGFAAFAERLGAKDLSDLLEAAAAYTAVIEGRPHFSRPHLMRQVVAVLDDEGFTRETGLRSFGTLLRTGRVVRVKRGQYALADDSRYMTEARAQ